MLKKLSVFVIVLMLAGCVSEVPEKRFQGTGDFDKGEAAKTRVSLGLTYLKTGNFSQAKFNLDKALDFAPTSGQANFAMAFYYQQVGEVKRAHEYYKEAISYSKDDPDILNSYGAFLCKQGDYKQAKSYFLEAVDDKSYVSTAETYENLAICSESQGLVDEAIVYFTSALNHQPTRRTSLLYLSELYVETGQWDLAKKSLWKYERNAGSSADSTWLAFQTARGEQNLQASVTYAETLKRLYPDNPNTQKALAALGKFQPDMTVTQKSRTQIDSNIVIIDTTEPDTNELKVPTTQQQDPTSQLNSETRDGDLLNESAQVANATLGETELQLEQALQIETPASQDNVADTTTNSITAVESTTAVVDSASNIVNNSGTPFHIVLPKENLYRISLKYNVKIKKLLEWNGLESASSIQMGTKLWVRDPNTNE